MQPGEYYKMHLTELPKSFKLTSEECFFLSGMDPSAELKQVLSVHDDGKVYWNRYFISDTHNGEFPSSEKHELKRNRYNIGLEKAAAILGRISEYFQSMEALEYVCDGGTWEIDIECSDGKHLMHFSSMSAEGELSKISYELRCMLEQGEIWAFDGAFGRKPGDIVVCDIALPGISGCYCYNAGELPVSYNDRVVVPDGPENEETTGIVKDIHFVNPTGENEPFGRLKRIIKIAEL